MPFFFFLVGDVVETNSVTDFPTSGIVWWKFVSESCGVLERTPEKSLFYLHRVIAVEQFTSSSHHVSDTSRSTEELIDRPSL